MSLESPLAPAVRYEAAATYAVSVAAIVVSRFMDMFLPIAGCKSCCSCERCDPSSMG